MIYILFGVEGCKIGDEGVKIMSKGKWPDLRNLNLSKWDHMKLTTIYT